MSLEKQTLTHYRRPGPMTALASVALEGLPDDADALASVLQGLVLHLHIAPAYGESLTTDRAAEAQLRKASDVLARMVEIDGRPLTSPREAGARVVGVCRHYTLLLTAMLRAQGVPARARCGFASYFEPGRYLDHWVGEVWDAGRAAWRLVDAQIDGRQKTLFKIEVDPLDVPRDAFLVASDAWHLCRAGKADPAKFGILDMNGYWFIAGNLVRDLAALNNMEMLPWDIWGAMPDIGSELDEAALARFDALADSLSDPDANFAALQALYAREWAVPPAVFNAQTNRLEPI